MPSSTFASRYGPWALVTGAARGLGTEFARQIAEKGLNLVLVDMLADELAQIVEEVHKDSSVQVRSVVVDLASADFIATIRQKTDDIEIGLLVSNAAHTPVGLFFDRTLDDKLKMIHVNCRAPLLLVQEFGAKMVSRRRGGIILISSGSALQGVPYVANYAATKAYNLILAEGLWDELRQHNVDVMALMPGATRTTGFVLSKPRLERSTIAPVMEPGPTAAEALRMLGRTPSWIPGRRNRWTLTLAHKLLPRRYLIKLVGSNMRQWYGEKRDSR